jgi:hypothetical protein
MGGRLKAIKSTIDFINLQPMCGNAFVEKLLVGD